MSNGMVLARTLREINSNVSSTLQARSYVLAKLRDRDTGRVTGSGFCRISFLDYTVLVLHHLDP